MRGETGGGQDALYFRKVPHGNVSIGARHGQVVPVFVMRIKSAVIFTQAVAADFII